MSNRAKEAYSIWAPLHKQWVDWVRPVPFIAAQDEKDDVAMRLLRIEPINFVEPNQKDTAIFVDLTAVESVEEGLSLACIGYRPVPIFNGTVEMKNAKATVDNRIAGQALIKTAPLLNKMTIADDASPAFLLDSNRMHCYKTGFAIYDNSWDLYHQDVPSGQYLWDHGIRKIIIHGYKLNKDLKKICYNYQKKGITIYLAKGYDKPKKVTLFYSGEE